MKEEISFELGSFFANAGIIGLLKMLDQDPSSKGNFRYNETKDTIYINIDYLQNSNLTELFINGVNQLEIETGKLPCILNKIKDFSQKLKVTELSKEEIVELNINLKQLELNSYKKAYEVIKKENKLEDIYDLITQISKEKNQQEIKKKLTQIIKIIERKNVFQILFFREIAYRRINKFWDSISFLNRNNITKNIKEIHAKTFEEPFKEYLKAEKKGNYQCEECGDNFPSRFRYDYSFLKGTTADTARKKNDFWNYRVNSWICPKCRWLYSLIPLGFSKYQQKYLFLNCNQSIEALTKINTEFYKDNFTKNDFYYQNILIEYLKKQTEIRNNIEVILAGEKEKMFTVNIIPKEILNLIYQNLASFENLISRRIKINDQTIFLFDIVFQNLLRLKDNYGLIGWLIKKYINEKDWQSYYLARDIAKIQFNLSKKREENENMDKEVKNMEWRGRQLQQRILETKHTKDTSVVNSLAYKLENAARINDTVSFTSIVLRACMSYKAPLPSLLINGLEHNRDYQSLEYAYILGLLSANGENKNEEKNEGGI
ncbi:MAG: hypothetical protein HFI09_01730 [Bacilli bacterium]|nr:hypothetical protein [Bacilli bacterium]